MAVSEVFDDLMDHWEEQFSQGNELAPEALCQEHPEFLESARKCIRAMKAIGGGAGITTVTSPDSPRPRAYARHPEVAGYEILNELGRGGMGIVYRARQTSVKRFVALKMVLREDLASSTEIARFHGEAEALGQLQHPNIVQVYDVGESGGHPYFALELVTGGSLEKRLVGEPLPPFEAAEMIRTLARAVHFAHERGFIHRDLKPGNVLLGPAGELKITDFGLAKRWSATGLAEDGPARTASGEVLGTPAYMAPEQARGDVHTLSPSVDIYALGAMLYEMITGQLPFRGVSLIDILERVVHSSPTQPRRVQPGIPRDLETICLKCLGKDPARRYLTANLLAEDLQRFLDGKPILARPITLPARFWRWCRRNPLLACTSIAAFLALLATAIVSAVFAIESERGRKDLQQGRDQLRQSLATSEAHRKESLRRLAESSLDRGLSQCDQGEIAQGMWWLVRALEAAEGSEDLQFVIEANLAAWSSQLCVLERILEHPQHVEAVAISADSRLLAAAIPGESRIHLWSLATGEPSSLELTHGGQEVTALAFHPFKPILASGGKDRQVRIWQVGEEVKLLFTLPYSAPVDRLRFSDDGHWLAARAELKLSVRDASDDYRPGQMVDQTLNAFDFAFLPQTPLLMTADFVNRRLHFWDYTAGMASGPFLKSLDSPLTVAASADGRYFATAGLKILPTLYLAQTRQRLSDIPGIPDNIRCLAFHPQSALLLMGKQSGSAGMWNALEARPHGSSMAHTGSVTTALFTPDGLRVATSAFDRTTRVWRLPAEPERRSFPHPKKEKVIAASIAPKGDRIVSLSRESTLTPERVLLWDAQSGKEIGSPLRVLATKTCFDDSGRWVLLWGTENQVRLWDSTTGELSPFAPSHDGALISDAVFDPRGQRLVTGGQDGTIRIWDRSQEKLVHPPLQHGQPVSRLVLNAQGTRLLAFGTLMEGKEQTTLWDTTTGKRVLDFDPRTIIQAAAFSPDGKWLATSGKNGTIRLWDPTNGIDLGVLQGHAALVTDLAFHPDSGLLVSASEDGTVRLWNVTTKELVGALRHQREVGGVVFSPDGRTLLTRSLVDASVRLWDLTPFRQLGPPRMYSRTGTGHFQSQAFFAPDSKSFLLAGDSTVRQFAAPASRNRGAEAWGNYLRARTGQELDAGGAFKVLNDAEWRRSSAAAPEEK